MPKYPDIEVKLLGQDGNVFFVLGAVQQALREHNVPQAEIDQFFSEATQGDYNQALRTVLEWVAVV